MEIVCAWCGKYLGEKDGGGVEGVSHAICEGCLDKVVAVAESETRVEDKPDE